MLLDFTVSNFRSFRKPATLSFVRPSLKTQTPKAPASWESSTYRVGAIFGPNASGKSNLMQAFATLSASMNGRARLYTPHSLARPEQPTHYDVNFTAAETRYHYIVEASPWGISREELHAYPRGRARLLFRRTHGGLQDAPEIEFGPGLSGPNAAVKRLLTPGDLFLATAARYEHATLLPIANAIRLGTTVVQVQPGPRSQEQWLGWVMARLVENPAEWSSIVSAIAQAADLGIVEVEVEEREIPREILEKVRSTFAAAMNETERQDLPEDSIPSVARSLIFTHEDLSNQRFRLSLNAESIGTLTWLATAVPAAAAIRQGDLLLVDELDASLHSGLTSALVEMFKDETFNRSGAQMLFTTHDTTMLGNIPDRLLDQGEVWFTEKTGADSTLFSLDEFDSRPGNNEQKRYLSGRFGAIPAVDLSRLYGHPFFAGGTAPEDA